MSTEKQIVNRIAARYTLMKQAGPLRDVSKLRYQAVFLMGAGGSGKGYASHKWLKYMPGGGMSGHARDEWNARAEDYVSEAERGLTNLRFESAKKRLESIGIHIELTDMGQAKFPFRLYDYDHNNRERLIPSEEWEDTLPSKIYNEVQGMVDLVFSTPKHELPSYWRQVNPDIYKEEIAGYMETQPGYVHEMSSEMSKAYLQAAVETGDPLFIDGTGSNAKKLIHQMSLVKSYGYRTSLVLVFVPLTVNHIRNATRSRNVNPRIVTSQWNTISSNFEKLRSMSDVSKTVINRNDSFDTKRYNKNREKIDAFIRKGYGGQYTNLRELIAAESPSELGFWDQKLDWNGELESSSNQDRIRQLREEKNIRRRYAHLFQ